MLCTMPNRFITGYYQGTNIMDHTGNWSAIGEDLMYDLIKFIDYLVNKFIVSVLFVGNYDNIKCLEKQNWRQITL